MLRLAPVIRLAPARGVLRVLRGGTLAVCSTVLATAAHAAAGGGVPDMGLVVLVMVLLAAGGAGLARRRRSLPGIVGVLTLTQVVLHFLLASAEGHESREAVYWPGWHMVAAHAVAVLLTALVLTRAESAVFALAAALAHLIPRPLILVPAGSAHHDPVVVAEPVHRVLRVLLCRVCPRRGPPFCF